LELFSMIDRLLALCILIFLVPLLVLIAVSIMLVDGWPVLFVQERVGKDGKSFWLYKFRTMVRDAESMKRKFGPSNESDGPVFKIHNDPRFTAIGKILSHIGLDELPQLVNIIIGDMVFIGPRPLPIPESKKLMSWMHIRENVLPGIISPAILSGNYHKDFAGWMKKDVEYAQTKSYSTDILLIVPIVLFLIKLVYRELKNLSCAKVG
jgi:lipopolysaccharide/colanic/teichoic acid biosynthesis glycosyltransferase